MGCICVPALSAPEALRLIHRKRNAQEPFDAAIIDHMMPVMGGNELALAIKADPNLNAIKLVMLTSRELREDAPSALKSGFIEILTKPVKKAQLQNAILAVFDKSEEDRQDTTSHFNPRHKMLESGKLNIRVLLAEDNITNQKIALHMLKEFGYTANAVANGKEAVDAFMNLPYDVILMDIQMPVMDGITAARRIRKLEAQSGDEKSHRIGPVPIIAMTANAMKGDREKCLDAGMDDYISKPVDPEDLDAMIEKWTQQGKTQKIDLTGDPSLPNPTDI